jgi:hypothetical protein
MLFLLYCLDLQIFMQVRLSGSPSPSEIIGRDAIIAELWLRIQQGSVVITAERRMGKTSIIQKMNAQRPINIIGDYQDLEGITSPEGLVRSIYHKVYEVLSGQRQLKQGLQNLFKDWSGEKLPQPKISWQQNLELIIRDLSKQLEPEEVWVFFWDELPLAIDNIRRDHGNSTAMSVLDTFRSIRQTYHNIRMVYTGSIGLHHVLGELRSAGYKNSPVNDMYPLTLPPLSNEDAMDLAQQLLIGEGIATEGLTEISEAIVQAVDQIPFYIHHLVASLKNQSQPLTVITVAKTLAKSLEDVNVWELGDYAERIQKYYLEDKYEMAIQTLDELSMIDQTRSFSELLKLVGDQVSVTEKENFRQVLKLLILDHYISRNSDGNYYFRLQLIKKYWQTQRRG